MKFSPDVNHKPVVNWWKNFGHSTIDMSATPLFVSKLWERLAPVLFEISQKKFFWWGSRPIWVTQWKEFQISVKKWRFEIFRTSALSRGNRVIHDMDNQGYGYGHTVALFTFLCGRAFSKKKPKCRVFCRALYKSTYVNF